MTHYTDVMVDTETTGLDPHLNGLMQIAAVKFNYATGEIGPAFDRCMAMAPNRHWDEDTRTWWGSQRKDILQNIIRRMEAPQQVLIEFAQFMAAPEPVRFWAKPVHFDFPMIASHYRQFGMVVPINYRFTRDLNTYVAAMNGGADHHQMEHVEPPADAHNALVDVVYQLKILFAAKARDFGPVGVEYAEIENV
jgi:DNA polymerase III alpha subunit (gram-positive type)